MQTIDLGFHSQARVWLKDSLPFIYPALDIISQDIQTGLACKSETRQAALEIFIPVGPRVCYGLLGAKFIPNPSGKLSVEVRVSTENESIFSSSMAAQVDTVKIGLPEEYSQSVMEGIVNSLTNDAKLIETLGSGVIAIEQAAYGEISSSKKMFRNIAATVIQLLLLDQASCQDEVTKIVKTHSLASR
ncbi:hypothetical protein L2E81_22495 [Planktothrix agardhii 1033]|uniref:hypothetical protein n=1 Tax=Planktothrix agardhii TaxID=1160 RepID=UPI001F234153|nr:hypothetical protein [Planktothrix agardhii]MCF3609202.1 hypothetical protein [Planktothrix agardhii 1033]